MSDIRSILGTLATTTAAVLLVTASAKADDPAPAGYEQHTLVSDGSVPADHTDPNLVNAWGIVFNPTALVWVANNGTGTSTLYDGSGQANPLIVSIPAVNGDETGNPTGIVFSGGNDFVVKNGTASGPARFIFAAENGTLSAWSPMADPTHAIIVANSSSRHAVYKGVALGGNGSGHFLYATDFHNKHVDVFDASFKPTSVPGAFTDARLPQTYAPFGIQNVNGDIIVTFARRATQGDDERAGPGLGIVDEFDADGHLIARLVTHGPLNAPWGIALAPRGFGRFGGALLIGNFGDGAINAFDPHSGDFLGALRDDNHDVLHVDGLWGMAFGNGVFGQKADTLFFAAGPHDEAGGAYGMITAQHR